MARGSLRARVASGTARVCDDRLTFPADHAGPGASGPPLLKARPFPARPGAQRASPAQSEGRDFVIPDDIKTLAPCALTHRLVLGTESRLRGTTPEKVVEDMIRTVPVPVEGPS
ncbi:MAG: hypothetical protein AB1563_04045 [Bacillota bacterium]